MKEKNYTLYCVKGFAALIILCMHSIYPRVYVPIINDLTKVGVMIFFLTSGFYWKKDRTRNNIIKLVKILGISLIIYLFIDCCLECVMGSPKSSFFEWIVNVFSISNVIDFVLFNIPFISAATPLWFLIALIWCYIFMYFAGENRQILIFALVLPLLSYFFQMANRFGYIDLKESILINPEYYRNWIFVGIPFFAIGALLNYSKAAILSKDSARLKVLFGSLIVGGGVNVY